MFQISDTECETEAGASSEKRGQSLFTFCSENASLIKFLTVAEVPQSGPLPSELEYMDTEEYQEEDAQRLGTAPSLSCTLATPPLATPSPAACYFRSGSSHTSSLQLSHYMSADPGRTANHEFGCSTEDSQSVIREANKQGGQCQPCNSVSVGTVVLPVSDKEHTKVSHVTDYPNCGKMHLAEHENKHSGNLPMLNASCPLSVSEQGPCSSSSTKSADSKLTTKYLIFVTGEFAVALHQIGIKVMTVNEAGHCTNRAGHGAGHSCQNSQPGNGHGHIVVNVRNNDIEMRDRQPDKTDFLLDLHGHVTGMCLSNDSR